MGFLQVEGNGTIGEAAKRIYIKNLVGANGVIKLNAEKIKLSGKEKRKAGIYNGKRKKKHFYKR